MYLRKGGKSAWADLSPDGDRRYTLGRRFNPDVDDRRVAFVILNPSPFNVFEDDRVTKTCAGFSERYGATSMVILNLFSWRTTRVADLSSVADPEGPSTKEVIKINLTDPCVGVVIAAWGACPAIERKQIATVALYGGNRLYCFGLDDFGAPKSINRVMPTSMICRWRAPK